MTTTRELFDQSIKKWEKIVHGTGIDQQAENCALCIAHPGCGGCPVYEATGYRQCLDTPYTAWARYCRDNSDDDGYNLEVFDDESKQLAQAELDYLIKLRNSLEAV